MSNEEKTSETIASWVNNRCEKWEEHREANYDGRWAEYYRLWRGIWRAEDKERKAERSRIITPATQQAVEAVVSDIEEAVFSRDRWVEIEVEDENDLEAVLDAQKVSSKLLDDLKFSKVDDAIREVILNAALYGTGIAKIVVTTEKEPQFTTLGGITNNISTTEVPKIKVIPVEPTEFLIDPFARTIEEATGVAHVTYVPKSYVERKQKQGLWRNVDVGAAIHDDLDSTMSRFHLMQADYSDSVKITEYHGLVPRHLFEEQFVQPDVLEMAIKSLNPEETREETDEMVEAIIVLANDGHVLAAVENPNLLGDRGFIAFQFDTVPNQFWGRGVVEKGYNAQKALDTEFRARIDALALSTYPMVIVDSQAVPSGLDYTVRPGRNLFVQGDPNNAFREFKFSGPDPGTMQHANTLERMVTMATGGLDTAAPMVVNSRNETASGMSQMQGAFIKRSKRIMRNLEVNFLRPLIKKFLWRSMQYLPERYPMKEYKFIVHTAMGLAAREFEVAQLTQLLQTTPPDNPAYYILLQSILQNYTIDNKDKLIEVVQNLLEQSMQPQEEKSDPRTQVELEKLKLDAKKHLDNMTLEAEKLELKRDEMEAEAQRDRGEAIWNQSEALLNAAKAETESIKAYAEIVKGANDSQKAESDAILKEAQAIAHLAKAESEEIGSQLKEYKSILDNIASQQREMAEAQPTQIPVEHVKEVIREVQSDPVTAGPDYGPMLEELRESLSALAAQQMGMAAHLEKASQSSPEAAAAAAGNPEQNLPPNVEVVRDESGLVTGFNRNGEFIPAKRDERGFLKGV